MDKNGIIIVLDGLDGSGKSTQFELVKQQLSEGNLAVKAISFPDYDKPSSALVKMYLGGEFSKNAADVNAYAASSFYAVDRYASFKLYWEDAYLRGDLILASRYVTSNAIHQMVKLNKSKWSSYLDWLSDYEYEKLGLPRADKVIFLDMPIEISQKMLSERYNGDESKKDIHEGNLAYLSACREAALYSASKQNWSIVTCSDGKLPLKKEEILSKIMKTINEVI